MNIIFKIEAKGKALSSNQRTELITKIGEMASEAVDGEVKIKDYKTITILTKREAQYLKKLLNNEATDLKKKYPPELYDIQEKLQLYPRFERSFCPICKKSLIVKVIRRGKGIYPNKYHCGKENCRKELIKWRKPLPKGE